MSVELVTGQGASEHIGSEDFGAYNAATFGPGSYVLSGCEAEVVDANTIRIGAGELLIEGRHIRVKGSEDIKIQSGAVERNRTDLLVIRYTKDASSIEDAPIVSLPGVPVEGEPSDPAYIHGSILAGDTTAEIPIYRIKVTGLTVGEPELLLEKHQGIIALWDCLSQKSDTGHKHSAADITSGTLPVARGGTGVTTDKALALKAYPVGAVYISYVSTSPASLFGGTWVQITGRVLRMANDVSTGGSDSHTHGLSSGYGCFTLSNTGHTHYRHISTPEWMVNWVDMPTTSSWHTSKAYSTKVSAGMAIGGSSGSTTNLPAYQDLYAWRRTA